jgi:hypothetical protein
VPRWMIAILKWGGLALAVVNGLALLALGPGGPAPAEDPSAGGQAGGSVGLLLFGLVAAGIGCLADRMSRH